MAVTSTSFKKGQSGNPNGRPVGSYSPLRKQLMELRKLAANDVTEIYSKLKEAVVAKEAWAFQIYFKELVSIPKEWLNEVSIANVPTEIKSVNDINHAIAALASALLSVDTIPTDEALNLIKTLSSVKLTEEFGKQKENPFDKLSQERMLTIKSWLDEV